MDIPPTDEAWLAKQVDAALAPYVGKLAEADLAWMREQLTDRLRTDRDLALLAHRAEPRTVDESGEIYYGKKPGGPAERATGTDDEGGDRQGRG
jgi:hypothetical protein